MCSTDGEGSKTDCGKCTCSASAATCSGTVTILQMPGGRELWVRKCDTCGRAC